MMRGLADTLFGRSSLARQFLVASGLVLFIGALGIGWWTGLQIERSVISRVSATTALYVDSFVAPRVQSLAAGSALQTDLLEDLDALLESTALGERIVSFKIWSTDGTILYSREPDAVGRTYEPGPRLLKALNGDVSASISDLSEPENEFERRHWSELLEIYSPARRTNSDDVIAVLEVYQPVGALRSEIAAAMGRTWLVVAGATLALYLLLAGIVGRGSSTIRRQRQDLLNRIAREREMVDQNHRLRARVERAGASNTELGERYLRRVSADLHDGPAQDLGLAMLRLGELEERTDSGDGDGELESAIRTSADAVQRALTAIRTISSGLRIPELDDLSAEDVVSRAVRDFRAGTSAVVSLTVDGEPAPASSSCKIALYRITTESLLNGLNHGGGKDQRVELSFGSSDVSLVISDSGPGFDTSMVGEYDGGLGLLGMRDRVAMLGGEFRVESRAEGGTSVRARIPLQSVVESYE